jgi:hypothetical protein
VPQEAINKENQLCEDLPLITKQHWFTPRMWFRRGYLFQFFKAEDYDYVIQVRLFDTRMKFLKPLGDLSQTNQILASIDLIFMGPPALMVQMFQFGQTKDT